jgi:hypothetical protein
VSEFFPRYQQDYASIPAQLRSLNLPGAERAQDLLDSLSEVVKGSAADAAARLGSEEAPLVDDLKWVRQVKQAIAGNEVDEDVEQANDYLDGIPDLPSVGAITTLKQDTREPRQQIEEILGREAFYEHIADLQSHLTTIETRIEAATEKVREAHHEHLQNERERLQDLPEWGRMDTDDQSRLSEELDEVGFDIPPGLHGLQQFTRARVEIDDEFRRIEDEICERGAPDPEPQPPGGDGRVGDSGGQRVVRFEVPKEFSSVEDIDRVIDALEQLKDELKQYETIVLDW